MTYVAINTVKPFYPVINKIINAKIYEIMNHTNVLFVIIVTFLK